MKRILKIIGIGSACLLGLPITAFFVMMMGFFDIVERSYQTKTEAAEDRLFDRGWLPAFIPDSATHIKVINNLDINTSIGSFDFAPDDFTAFADAIHASNDGTSKHGSNSRMQELKQAGYEDYDICDRGACWRFLIHPQQGRCEYWASVNR